MDLTTTLGVIGTAVTALAAVTAVGSWRAAAKANQAAERANATADTLAQIERDRWHAELTPKLQVELTGAVGGRVELKVTLSGPPGLDRLDDLSISVRDDGDDHPVSPGMSAQETQEASHVIWGPYRFVRDVDGASRDGKHAPGEGTVAQGNGGYGARWKKRQRRVGSLRRRTGKTGTRTRGCDSLSRVSGRATGRGRFRGRATLREPRSSSANAG